jgi:hypothetical protein
MKKTLSDEQLLKRLATHHPEVLKAEVDLDAMVEGILAVGVVDAVRPKPRKRNIKRVSAR